MFREKFILTFTLALLLLAASIIVIMVISHSDRHLWFLWFSRIWLRVLAVCMGIDFGLTLYIGWDYIDPKETRLPIYLALAASMLIALIYKGVTMLIGMF